jgi:hypothetical protein
MFRVEHDIELDRVKVFKNGELVGECEAYELDAILAWLEVQYVEIEEEF